MTDKRLKELVDTAVWDWIFGRPGQLTLEWQGGMMSTLFTAWLLSRSNAHADLSAASADKVRRVVGSTRRAQSHD